MTKTDKEKNEEEIMVDDLELKKEGKASGKKDKKRDKQTGEAVSLSQNKLILILQLLSNIKENNEQLLQLISGMTNSIKEGRINIGQMTDESFASNAKEKLQGEEGGRVIEGVFDGENMIGPDGKQYSVPANYASKSKLVEGDILKLTITGAGTFVYKQIGPIERKRLVGKLELSSNDNFYVTAENKSWRVLTASVTYFKGNDGDEIVILVPQAGDSKWAAVENIVKNPN